MKNILFTYGPRELARLKLRLGYFLIEAFVEIHP